MQHYDICFCAFYNYLPLPIIVLAIVFRVVPFKSVMIKG